MSIARLFCLILLVAILSVVKSKVYSSSYNVTPKIDSIAIKAKRLKLLYILSTKSSADSVIYQQKFFDEFPNTFKQLDDLYGYEGSKEGILIDDAEGHIRKLFNNLNSIDDTLYYKKIAGIAIGGHWDADAINYFEYGLQRRVEDKPELIVFILQKMPESAIKSFWHFYFDGPHPRNDISEPLKRIKLLDDKIYNTMMAAHEEALKDKE